MRRFKCVECGHEFEVPFGQPRWTLKCPNCGSPNIYRIDSGFGKGQGWCRGWRGWKGRGGGKRIGKGFGWGKFNR